MPLPRPFWVATVTTLGSVWLTMSGTDLPWHTAGAAGVARVTFGPLEVADAGDVLDGVLADPLPLLPPAEQPARRAAAAVVRARARTGREMRMLGLYPDRRGLQPAVRQRPG